ncbi:MAG: hypothetical protein HYS22_08225 [Deltaproteobacteria bacterium]|nr:hypothetical protein [Deltaproteobacteria bacterium]
MRYLANNKIWVFLLAVGFFLIPPVTKAHELVSVSTSGEQGDDISGGYWFVGADRAGGYAINADGRYIAFTSWASNLVLGDPGRETDIFLRDTQRGTTIRLTTVPGGEWDRYDFSSLDISDDGRTVVYITDRALDFESGPSFFVFAHDTVVIHDRDPDGDGLFDEAFPETLTHELFQARIGGVMQDVWATRAYLSGNGRYVVTSGFWRGEDSSPRYGIFLHDRDTDGDGLFDEVGQVDTFLVEGIPNGQTHYYYTQPNLTGISQDGTYILYDIGTYDGADPFEYRGDVFVYNRLQQTNRLISKTVSGQPTRKSQNGSISPDGRFVAFESSSPELVAEDIYNKNQIFKVDRDPDENGILDDTPAGTVTATLVSYDASGLASFAHVYNPRINDRGNIVVFDTAGDLDWEEDNNNGTDIYINYNGNHTSSLVTRGLNGGANGESRHPQIDDRASRIVFSSNASNLVINDVNQKRDVFITTPGEGHSVCNLTTQQCRMVSGAGVNECITDSECLQSYQTCTLNGQCVTVAGIPLPGTPTCSSDIDCAEIIDPPCREEEGCFRRGCVDSDGGIEYGTAGHTDYFVDNELTQTATDECCSQGSFLKEYYCDQGAIKHRWFFCKLCDHGVCLETTDISSGTASPGYSVQAIANGDNLNSCGEIRDFFFPGEEGGISNAPPAGRKKLWQKLHSFRSAQSKWVKRLWKWVKKERFWR